MLIAKAVYAFSCKRINTWRWGEGDYEVLGGLESLLRKEKKGSEREQNRTHLWKKVTRSSLNIFLIGKTLF